MNELMENYYTNLGYVERIEGMNRTIGCSELAMCTHMAYKIVDYVLVKPNKLNYGIVIAKDGSFVDGCLNLFENIVNIS